MGTDQDRIDRRWLTLDLAFAACLVVYVAGQTALGRFVNLDEVFFKAAGREWAATGRFAAPEIAGFIRVDPPPEEIWFPHPPLYTFLFGVFVKAFGFGPRQCIVYDAAIHAVLAWLTYAAAKRFAMVPRGLAFLVGLAVLPLGTQSRPDELAMCFGMAGLLCLLNVPPTLGRVALSGCLFGLCAGTHLAPAILLGFQAFFLLALGDGPIGKKLRWMLLWAAVSVLVLAGTVAPILISHPTAYRQYTTHVAVHFDKGSTAEDSNRVAGTRPPDWSGKLRFSWHHGKPYLLFTAGFVLFGLCVLAVRPASYSLRLWAQLWLGPVAAILFLAGPFPDKYPYTWFVGPWMLVATAVSLALVARDRSVALARLLALVPLVSYAVAAAPFLKSTLVLLALPPSASLSANADETRRLIPPASRVVTDSWWWVLGNDCRVYEFSFAPDALPEQVDFLVLSADGAQRSDRLQPYLDQGFVVVHDNRARAPLSLFGIPLADTATGFGSVVMARNPPARK